MANKVRFYHIWEIKKILISVGSTILIIAIIAIIIFHKGLIYRYKRITFDKQTIGRLLELDEQESMSQTLEGNRLYVENYKVTYGYKINSESYVSTYLVDANVVNQKRLIEIWNSDKSVVVRYKSNDPSESMVDVLLEEK